MNKLKCGDLEDPPTYDSIVKSSVKYRTQKFTSYCTKKSKKLVDILKNRISKETNLIIQKLKINIHKKIYSSKLSIKQLRLNIKKTKKKILSVSKEDVNNINSNIQIFKEKAKKIISKLISFNWEKIVFNSSFALIILFLFFSFSPFLFADNDNSTYVCDGGDSCEKTNTDCDITSYGTTCTYTCTYWNIGGSGDSQGYPISGATLCCGDDASENYNYRQCYSGTTQGTFCSSSISDDACCDSTTDCIYNGVCFTAINSGINLNGVGEADAVCQSQTTYGRWVDCDESSSFCSYCDSGTDLPYCSGTGCYVITGESSNHGEYISGETECCGDDALEYYRTREADESIMENYADNPSDTACCNASTDCIDSSSCFTSGQSSISVDEDTDDDYCLNGEWIDCNSNNDCNPGFICYTTTNDCINVNGYIKIQNLGTTGIENTNQEYTSIRNVMLSLNFTENATKCRYTNYINNVNLPSPTYEYWSIWDSCLTARLWTLSEGSGLKAVFYQIEYPFENVTFNDTIYYNFTGGGLDLTPPSKPNVYHKNFTNDNQNITIYWDNVIDPESDLLGIPLQYEVYLYNQSNVLIDSATTLNKYYSFDIPLSFRQSHGVYLYANVTAVNSANLKNSSISNNLVIDLIGPNMIFVSGEAYNLSLPSYMTISNENSWFYANKVNLSWNASDTNSSIYAYSYSLGKSYQEPDNVPEGTIEELHESLDVIYSSLSSGKYYFTVKARDMAGNWGNVSSINFSIDNTPPSRFFVIDEYQDVNNITYIWSESSDLESDIIYYNATLIDSNGIENQSEKFDKNTREATFYNLSSQNYSAIIYVYNGAGMWTSTGDNQMILDITPPIINGTPTATVITNYPILKAWTNEQAICYYNNSDENIIFKYTNTTYHETKLNFSTEGPYTYEITCKDLYNNENIETINFTITNSLRPQAATGLPGTLNAYENIVKSFSFRLEDLDENEITGLLNQHFSLKLNNRNYPITVFDIGNGYYNLSFDPPSYGPYNMVIQINYLGHTLDIYPTLIVSKLGLNTIYEDSLTISNSNSETHLSYFTSDTRFGLATDYNLESEYIITNQNNKLNISGAGINNNIMIFNTKTGVSMLDRNKKINKNQFLSSVNPSFGYTINEEYFIRYHLVYDDYLIQGNNNIKNGKHDISILYVVENNQNIIRFQKPTSSDKIVLVSG